jgi:nucleoside-diphosphate-sugar epimerase
MKIFLAGATGVIGRILIPLLVTARHEVYGTTRTAEKSELLYSLGAVPVVVDVFDRAGLAKAVHEAQPDILIHQLTDLNERNFTANNHIRIEGTRNLVDAAREVGVNHFIAQSIAWAYTPGDSPADESVPLDLEASLSRRTTVEGVAALENAVAEMPHGIILRYGLFYGQGMWYAPDGMMAEQVRQGKITADEGITSFVHVEDAANATLAALDWSPGVVNIVDDEPAAGTVWLPSYAASLNAPAPPVSKEIPPFARGASNAKARQELNWQPRYPSWREGFFQNGQK